MHRRKHQLAAHVKKNTLFVTSCC